MSGSRHRRLGDLFLAASELPEDERRTFLERMCGDDAAMRAEVEEMLAFEGAEPTLLAAPPASASAVEPFLERLGAFTPPTQRYRVLDEVARGGMGVVLRVSDEALRRTLAMKVLPPDAPSSADALRRFVAEAQVTSQLDHPGIVPVHELGVDRERRVFFTMKLVEGETLQRVLGRVRAGEDGWSTTRVLGVLLRVCEALAFAHSRGILHRDLKPANIMIGRFGETYVMDWGLARVLSEQDERDLRLALGSVSPRAAEAAGAADAPLRTMDGHVIGTPCHMAPEQAHGQLDRVGPATDVYAMGTILYELLTGRAPYQEEGASSSPLEVVEAVRREPPAPLASRAASAPAELVSICERAMARRIEDRYPDMAALGEDLAAYLENRVVRAHARGPLAELRKWIRRNRAVAASIAVAVSTAILASLSFAWEQRRAARAIAQEKTLAQASEARAREERDNLLRVSDVRRVQGLLAEADRLWPALAERIPAMEDWLGRAEEVLGRRRRHEETLAVLRERITAEGAGEDGHATWSWWHDTLSDLIAGLDELSGDAPQGRTVASVLARIDLARELPARTIGAHRTAWDEAIDAIARADEYGGLELTPQVGLVPLGPDPHTGLWEFWHWQSGAPATRDAQTGELALGPEAGLVLVLLPAGTFTMGSQSIDPAARDFDPSSKPDEEVHEATVAPFFLSKFEMTQAQWERLAGHNPSYWTPDQGIGRTAPVHPVDQVSWTDCRRYLPRFDLALPTEVQWEYATRGGTETIWWTGSRVETLEGAANIADRTFASAFPEVRFAEGSIEDGFPFPAPVGSLRANPFGLHDVLGNVWEWCDDVYDFYGVDHAPADGEEQTVHRVIRGGCFDTPANAVRSAARQRSSPINRHNHLGVRPARVLR